MGRIIAVGAIIVIIALIIAGVVIYHRRKNSREKALEHGWALSGDLTAQQEQQILDQNAAAAALFTSLLAPSDDLGGWNPHEITIIGASQKVQIEAWMHTNAKTIAQNRRKGITR